MKATEGSYKGRPTLTLNPDAKFPFTFGAVKAKLILENLDAIREFSAKYPVEDKSPAAVSEAA
jgi:hypothetical protein